MGTWGPGVFQNDQALDLCSIEVDRLVGEVEAVLAQHPVAFDDIEGPLLYVHMLAKLAEECDLSRLDRGTVEGWKEKYLDIFNSTITGAKEAYVAARREIVAREFDALASKLRQDAPKPAAKKPAKKTRK